MLGLEHFFILAPFPSTQLCSFFRHPRSAGVDDHHAISSIGVQRRLRVAKSSDRCKKKPIGEMEELWMSIFPEPPHFNMLVGSPLRSIFPAVNAAQTAATKKKKRTGRVSMNGNVMREKEVQNDGLRS